MIKTTTMIISNERTPKRTHKMISTTLAGFTISVKHFSELGTGYENHVVNFKNESRSHSPISLQVMFL